MDEEKPMHYLIQATSRGETILLRGKREQMEYFARLLQQQKPNVTFRVSSTPTSLWGFPLVFEDDPPSPRATPQMASR
jgi:hypothetical protein